LLAFLVRERVAPLRLPSARTLRATLARARDRCQRDRARSAGPDPVEFQGCHPSRIAPGRFRYLRERVQRIAEELCDGGLKPNPAKTKLLAARSDVIAGWHALADALLAVGQGAIAEKIWAFIGGMHRPLTTDEQLVSKLEERTGTRERQRQEERSR
jgi:hypothetical protein